MDESPALVAVSALAHTARLVPIALRSLSAVRDANLAKVRRAANYFLKNAE